MFPLADTAPNPTSAPDTNYLSANPSTNAAAPEAPADRYGDTAYILNLFKGLKEESMQYRWVWEREWLRDLYYVANRQWIFFQPATREWIDKRLQKWIPRPVTNKIAETLQAIRTNLGAINLAVTVRPVGDDTQSIGAAEIADQMSPLIHEEHLMNQVMREADFWFIATGNACLQISWDRDTRFNRTFIQNETCVACGASFPPDQISAHGNTCPTCNNPSFTPTIDAAGKPQGQWISFGRGKTTALSPFEWAVPSNITRFDELPYLIRLRWRDKHYYEANLPDLVPKITWERSPSDRSLQIFKSLALTNDVGTGSHFAYLGSAASHTVEGITEYELWLKPTPEFPRGLLARFIGDRDPILLQKPDESVPGPFPYTDIEGNPLFPFVHAQFEHLGGRLLGRSALSPLIQKQDQLNQLDSLVQLIVQRMANPVWVVPEGAGVENITGEPGLVMKWNPLAANGQGKPERIEGAQVPQSLFLLREQLLKDIEDLSGAFDIIKGQKPTGVEAFSALQLLVERSQSRFTSAFQSRGEMYRAWFAIALELERQFGPHQRVYAVVGPNKSYTFQHFENAQLQGQVSVQIEDGSNMPKTSLGKRAAIEQANQLQLLNPQDPDQKYALLSTFGLTDLVPSLNFHVQAALQMQDAFEKWVGAPQGPPPLVIKPWHDPQIHWNERVKWLNTDRMRELLAQNPTLEQIIDAHLQALQQAMQPPPGAGEKPPTIAYSFKGPDLADPQVRQVFDQITGLPPVDPMTAISMATPPTPVGPGPFGAQGPFNARGPKPASHSGPGGAAAMGNHARNLTPRGANLPGGNAQLGPNVGPH